MKLQPSLRIIFAAALLTLLGACATMTSGPAALAGTWTNSLGTVWTINADGTFHVMSTKPKAGIWGNYTVAGDTITIQETRRAGSIPKNCRGPPFISSAAQTEILCPSFWSVTLASRGSKT